MGQLMFQRLWKQFAPLISCELAPSDSTILQLEMKRNVLVGRDGHATLGIRLQTDRLGLYIICSGRQPSDLVVSLLIR